MPSLEKIRYESKRIPRRLFAKIRRHFTKNATVRKRVTPLGSTAALADFFLLDESAAFEIENDSASMEKANWGYPIHLEDPRFSLVLKAGETFESALIQVPTNPKLLLRTSTALPSISPDGLTFSISFLQSTTEELHELGTFYLPGKDAVKDWTTLELDLNGLSGMEGCLQLACGPGPSGDGFSDWLAIADLCIARESELRANLARTHHKLRIKNEIAHFSKSYRNDMYQSVQDRHSAAAQGIPRQARKLVGIPDAEAEKQSAAFLTSRPRQNESVYGFASRLLKQNTSTQPPDYVSRIRNLVGSRGKIKVLSLCSGAARIEAGIASEVSSGIDWTLLDINEDLLQLASKQFPPQTNIDLVLADVNDLKFTGETWDVILCVSALHHVVELEKVMEFIANSLNDGGEFWSIGEAVGRNGNRLWPEARQIADSLFRDLPEPYRKNFHTEQTDVMIPDNDFSIASFEGIRSEEILPIVDRWFDPIEIYRNNCFLWRILNLAYSQNFNLSCDADVELILNMVKAEIHHYKNGGRGTALWGAFRRRGV